MKALVTLSAVTALTGCDGGEPMTMRDQCLRQQIFLQCLVDRYPDRQPTVYTEWDEAINACNNVSNQRSDLGD